LIPGLVEVPRRWIQKSSLFVRFSKLSTLSMAQMMRSLAEWLWRLK
jgi:hypothetical protein